MICLREQKVRGFFQTFLFSLGRRALYRDTRKYSKFKNKIFGIFLQSINDTAKTKSLKLLGRSKWPCLLIFRLENEIISIK